MDDEYRAALAERERLLRLLAENLQEERDTNRRIRELDAEERAVAARMIQTAFRARQTRRTLAAEMQ